MTKIELTEKTAKEVIKLKRKLEESNIDTSNLMYCPTIPMVGFERSFVIEEVMGIKVAYLISAPDDD